MSVKHVVGIHEAPDDLGWWSAHLGTFTTNIFAATGYEQNAAVGLVGTFKEHGISTYTEMLQIAAARHQRVMREKLEGEADNALTPHKEAHIVVNTKEDQT